MWSALSAEASPEPEPSELLRKVRPRRGYAICVGQVQAEEERSSGSAGCRPVARERCSAYALTVLMHSVSASIAEIELDKQVSSRYASRYGFRSAAGGGSSKLSLFGRQADRRRYCRDLYLRW